MAGRPVPATDEPWSDEASEPVSVLIVDSHRLLAESLMVLLAEDGLDVLGAATTLDQALRILAQRRCNVVLFDPYSPTSDGLADLERLTSEHPQVRVVVFSASIHPAEVPLAVQAGASAFFDKHHSLVELVDVVRRAANGECVVPIDGLLAVRRMHDGGPTHPTTRELEVLRLLVQGMGTAEVANAMSISYSTARTHIQNLLTKLGVHSRLEAVAFAVSHRLVRIDAPASPDRTFAS